MMGRKKQAGAMNYAYCSRSLEDDVMHSEPSKTSFPHSQPSCQPAKSPRPVKPIPKQVKGDT